MIAVFDALSNDEAHYVRRLLSRACNQAEVMESYMWQYLFSETPAPQVWIADDDVERARPVLDAYEARGDAWRIANWRAEQQRAKLRDSASAATRTIEVTCEDCGRRSSFSVAQVGFVQDCPHCGNIVDVVIDA